MSHRVSNRARTGLEVLRGLLRFGFPSRGGRKHDPGPDTPTVTSVVWLAAYAGVAFLGFSVVLVALHFLRADLDPAAETVSQYAIGPYGYVMTIALLVLGLGVLALAQALIWGVASPSRLGSQLLRLAAISLFAMVVFPTNHDPGPMSQSEFIHNSAFGVSFGATIGSMFALTHQFSQDPRWRSYWPVSSVLWLAAMAGFVAVNGTLHTPWIGVAQRISVAIVLSWLLLTAFRLTSVARDQGSPGRLSDPQDAKATSGR